MHWSWTKNSGKSDHPKQWQSAAEWSETETTIILQYFKNMKQIFDEAKIYDEAKIKKMMHYDAKLLRI